MRRRGETQEVQMRPVGRVVSLGVCAGALALLQACGSDRGGVPHGGQSNSAPNRESGGVSASAPAAPAAASTAAAPPANRLPEGVTDSDLAQANHLFMARCAACHGKEGRGDGPGSLGLDPKPQNYTDPEWQKRVTDEEIEKAIVYGGAAVGKSPQMASNPELQAKPGVVRALRHKIRKFARP